MVVILAGQEWHTAVILRL